MLNSIVFLEASLIEFQLLIRDKNTKVTDHYQNMKNTLDSSWWRYLIFFVSLLEILFQIKHKIIILIASYS